MKRQLFILLFIVLVFTSTPSLAQEWLPVRDLSLEVEAGSALDFSSFGADAPAGKYGWATALKDGHIGFENLTSRQRFLCASFAFSKTSGGVPNKADALRIATQLKRAGYNAVRLHFLDAHLMTGRNSDFDFEPEQYDYFLYFLGQLKAAGIYWVIDVLDSDNGAYGAVYPHRWVNKYNLRLGFYSEQEKQEHWARLLQTLLGRFNPYTNTVPLQDPALLGLILINEGGIAELSTRGGGSYSSRFAPLFRQWLKRKYGNNQALTMAWKDELKPGESLETIIEVPAQLRGQNARTKDFMRFISEIEIEKLKWMTEKTRSMGYKGLLTAYNNWSFHQSDVTRASNEWIDMHSYHGLPTNFVSPGSKITQTSVISNAARLVRELAGARQWSKPFTVSEYGQPFWNSWRRESIALVPAYASLHGWDLITNFAENSFQLELKPSIFSRKNAIHPFGVSNDPILSTGERLSALLFKRGDVKSSETRLHLTLDAQRVFSENGGWGQLSENVSRLALMVPIGLDVDSAGNREAAAIGKHDYVLALNNSNLTIAGKIGNVVTRLGLADLSFKNELIQKGILPKTNLTDSPRQYYQSDTGELSLDVNNKQFIVDTPFTLLTSMDQGNSQVGGMTVIKPSVPLLVATTSIDGNPIAESKRMLIFVLTDAQNTGMEFKDATRTELLKLGHLPAVIQRVQFKFSLKSSATKNLKVYALSLAGKRRELVPATLNNGVVHVDFDTGMLKQGPSTVFELLLDNE